MNLGGPELFVIAGIVVLLFGAKKLPELFGALGQGIKEFKTGLNEPLDAPSTTAAAGNDAAQPAAQSASTDDQTPPV